MVRVVLVDDQHLVRAGMRALLERAPDITVAGEAADGETGVALVRAERPDVVLMDVRMPGVDGIEATRRIVADERLRQVRVVMLTTFDTDEYLFDAIRAGATGFLLKDARPGELRDAVRTVASGDALLSPAVTRRVLNAVAAASGRLDPGRVAGLTEREREVLAQIAAGRSNKEIGSALFISPATARTYVSRLLTKLDARDRAQLVVIAYESGLVRPGAT
ncbi:response regulator transcription factor [Sphaerisporangium sp. TRM90804]|uniref:response regulator transcription factor n=1 Tax=Sphaerisporangium sp. TRM90804 TaxID=3031113 RepID=UPI00244BF492|nr:response regulator transcription factor [Sphaerisporangium sp. TRM90804]MDH2426573.1 response regulator transcription factor [Sphaerisporangium sp. TRM90804]